MCPVPRSMWWTAAVVCLVVVAPATLLSARAVPTYTEDVAMTLDAATLEDLDTMITGIKIEVDRVIGEAVKTLRDEIGEAVKTLEERLGIRLESIEELQRTLMALQRTQTEHTSRVIGLLEKRLP